LRQGLATVAALVAAGFEHALDVIADQKLQHRLRDCAQKISFVLLLR
jgi:hypothetical protein